MKLPPCGDNPALKAISDAKTAIDNTLTAGKSALADLNSKMADFKNKVLSAVPKIPTLDSFQAELAGLIGASPSKIAAFLKKWEGKVEGLNELVAKVTGNINDILSMDFCKDVPNVKMDPVTKETKTEPPEPTPPTEPPPAPEPVVATVVDKAEEPVKPEVPPAIPPAPTNPNIVAEYKTKYTDQLVKQVFDPIREKKQPYVNEVIQIATSSEWKSLEARANVSWGFPRDLLRQGKLNPSEAKLAKKYYQAFDEKFKWSKIESVCQRFSTTCENALTSYANGMVLKQSPVYGYVNPDGTITDKAKAKSKTDAPGADKYIEKIAALVSAEKDVVIKHTNYKRSLGVFG
jgi:hypothetical protein